MSQSGFSRPSRQAGFSIVELIVSLGVIAVALFAIMSMIIRTVNTKEAQRELTTAKQAVTRKLEEFKTKPWEDMVAALQYLVVYPTTYNSSQYSFMPFYVDGLSHPQTQTIYSIPYAPTGSYTYSYTTLYHPGITALGSTVRQQYILTYKNLRGKGTVTVHGVYPDMTAPTLIDLEVTVEWVGALGPSRYSVRSLYSQ